MTTVPASTAATTYRMLIGGRLVEAAGGGSIQSTDPATGEPIGTVPAADERDVAAAVTAARNAAGDWARRPPRERAQLVAQAAGVLEDATEDLAHLDALDSGNPLQGMLKDVRTGVGFMRYMCGIAGEIKGETIPVGAGILDYTLRQPYGVVARINAYNHPLLFAAMKIAAPLIAGNSVILKPSTLAPLAPLEFARLVADVFPPGVLNVITGTGSECGAPLVRDPAVKRIAFIGSVETGRQIARDAADGGIKVLTLELGGKNPFIVLPDADIESAAEGAAIGMNLDWTLGQSCGSTSRVFVPAAMHDDLVSRIQRRFESLRIGIPTDPTTQVGCLVSKDQLARIRAYVESAIEEGADLVTGGRSPDGPTLAGGNFFMPTLFANVSHRMRIAREEVFGPVLSVIPYEDESGMLEQVNDVPYGLTANVWTNDLRAAHRLAERIEAGFVWINGDGRHFAGAPFGGYKSSGVGVEESLDELLSYTQTKNVSVFM